MSADLPTDSGALTGLRAEERSGLVPIANFVHRLAQDLLDEGQMDAPPLCGSGYEP